MKNIKECLITEWNQQQEQTAYDKMHKAFQGMSGDEIFELVWNTFTSTERETLYDEMDSCGYL